MSDLGHHAPDLTIFPLKNGQLDLRIAAFARLGSRPDNTDTLRRLCQAVRQNDPLPQPFQRLG